VWFGETLPRKALLQAVKSSQSGDIFISVGTSALVQPAASLPLEALKNRAITIEINPQSTPISPYLDFKLQGEAGTILPLLVNQMT
jgi:NAD-dependent deacetylase